MKALMRKAFLQGPFKERHITAENAPSVVNYATASERARGYYAKSATGAPVTERKQGA
ncbi:MAG: hypothetical protein ACI4KD_04295 [Oscillospiraceae bacterium]